MTRRAIRTMNRTLSRTMRCRRAAVDPNTNGVAP